MIPLYRTTKMEQAVNQLLKAFGRVLVHANYSMIPTVRIRPDLFTPPVYFSGAQSQITRWQDSGGALMLYDRSLRVGSFPAIFFAECPRSIEFLDRYSQEAQVLVVVHEPETWRIHFDCINKRFVKRRPGKLREALDAQQRMIDLLESSPRLTPSSLERLLRARPAATIQPSSAPESRATAERSSGTAAGVP